MADLVDQVLLEAAEKEARYKTTQIHKDIDLEIDAGNLLCIDHNPLELKSFRYVEQHLVYGVWPNRDAYSLYYRLCIACVNVGSCTYMYKF